MLVGGSFHKAHAEVSRKVQLHTSYLACTTTILTCAPTTSSLVASLHASLFPPSRIVTNSGKCPRHTYQTSYTPGRHKVIARAARHLLCEMAKELSLRRHRGKNWRETYRLDEERLYRPRWWRSVLRNPTTKPQYGQQRFLEIKIKHRWTRYLSQS